MTDARVEAVARAMMRCEAWPSLYSFKDACHLARAAIAAYEAVQWRMIACPRCGERRRVGDPCQLDDASFPEFG